MLYALYRLISERKQESLLVFPAIVPGTADFLKEPVLRHREASGASTKCAERQERPLIDLGVDRLALGERSSTIGLPIKEVIQPHLPVQLPCYDFVPVTEPDLGACLPKGLAQRLQSFSASMT